MYRCTVGRAVTTVVMKESYRKFVFGISSRLTRPNPSLHSYRITLGDRRDPGDQVTLMMASVWLGVGRGRILLKRVREGK